VNFGEHGKSSGRHLWTLGVKGVWPSLWPWVSPRSVFTSQKGSLEEVSEFLEVRAQVDHDLTTVSWVDRLLGLIKNLGRHMTGQTGGLDCPAPNTHTGQTGASYWSSRWPPGKIWELHKLKTSSNPLGNLLNACSKPKHAQTSPSCWQWMNQDKNAKMQPRACQIYK
jgi:hypothetical protein